MTRALAQPSWLATPMSMAARCATSRRGGRAPEPGEGPGVGAALPVGRTDVDGGGLRDVAQGGFIGESFGADDGGAALGVKCDQFQTGLDVAGDVLDRRQSSPGDDLFDVLRSV